MTASDLSTTAERAKMSEHEESGARSTARIENADLVKYIRDRGGELTISRKPIMRG